MGVLLLIILFIVDFLLGSIPWGVVISKIFFKEDIRNAGSGNIGATNALRTMGKGGGAAVFLLDTGKGFLAGLCSWLLYTFVLVPDGFPEPQIALAIAFTASILGHVFSPWLGFKGGKGIAVGLGSLIFTFGIWVLVPLGSFIILVAITRYVSLGSMAAAFACIPVSICLYWGNWISVAMICFTSVVVLWAHRSNMKRLASGTESKLGAKKPKGTA